MGGTAAKIVDTMSDVYGGIQMGTTMVMAHIDGNRLTIAHCGDSRCYVFDHCGKAKYVTTDHNAGESIGTPSAESTSAVRMTAQCHQFYKEPRQEPFWVPHRRPRWKTYVQ